MKYCPKCKEPYPLNQRFCSTDGVALTLNDPYNLLGRTLVEKYRLDALVGIGGMGAVYSAVHLNTGRQIAVKILLPNLAIGAPRLVELFEREARIVGRLKHENIVDIIDAGRTTENIAYIAMEWLEGYTLEEEIQWNGPLNLQRVSEILRQIAAALQESHTQHILHRDLKPSNIFLVKRTSGRDQVKVMDFGISKLVGDTQGSPVSSLMGTPQYASPEQFRLGENIDSRTDIYSLGVVLFQMLTNSLPFNDTTISALIYKHLNEPPPPLRRLRPEIPQALDELITRMLAKMPADRPQRVGDLPDLFDRAVSAHRVTVVNDPTIPESLPGLHINQQSPQIQPPIQPPIQAPMQPQMRPPTQPPMQPPMQPQMHPPGPPMQPRMQPPGQPADAAANETSNAAADAAANETSNAATDAAANETSNAAANAAANETSNAAANAATNASANASAVPAGDPAKNVEEEKVLVAACDRRSGRDHLRPDDRIRGSSVSERYHLERKYGG